jgi:carbamoyltransferase
MIVLGLHKDPWHNTGACVISGPGPSPKISFLSEERLDRVKDSRAFPLGSTIACLAEVGVASVEDVDLIVLDYIENDLDWRLDQKQRPCSTENFLRNVDKSKIRLINHHLCHAFASFMTSPFDEAAILVVDGRGSLKQTQSLYHGRGNRIELIDTTDKIGIGLLYAAMTQQIGFGGLQEGKTMGLAPLGAYEPPLDLDFKAHFKDIETDYSHFCMDGNYALKDGELYLSSPKERARAAYEVQKECERAMLHLAEYAKQRTGCKYLCISGGVGLNSVANNVILKANLFEDIFINPAASDTGIPLGAAFYGYHELADQPRIAQELSPYLGPSYSAERIEEAISAFTGFSILRENVFEEAIDLLCKNLIVARFEGRSEMGPRALGHRSLLMSPLKAENKDTLNSRVKHREAFRPFAPIVMAEYCGEYFNLDRHSPYMLLVPEVLADKREIIPAVTHVDGTARVQTVTSEFNGKLYDILRAFNDRTGVPVLLNTSFNVNGEPIVETPEDAIKCFLGTNIDALLIEDILLIKK